jgi:hypothetical protein
VALELAGTWTYRSFLNNPAPVNSPDDAAALIFGEGELVITEATPGGVFAASLSFGGDAVMNLTGTVGAADSNPIRIFAKGVGRADSPIPDYRYDYQFYVVPGWPQGVGQREALVGSVVRAADHGTARKGATASTITVRRDA